MAKQNLKYTTKLKNQMIRALLNAAQQDDFDEIQRVKKELRYINSLSDGASQINKEGENQAQRILDMRSRYGHLKGEIDTQRLFSSYAKIDPDRRDEFLMAAFDGFQSAGMKPPLWVLQESMHVMPRQDPHGMYEMEQKAPKEWLDQKNLPPKGATLSTVSDREMQRSQFNAGIDPSIDAEGMSIFEIGRLRIFLGLNPVFNSCDLSLCLRREAELRFCRK